MTKADEKEELSEGEKARREVKAMIAAYARMYREEDRRKVA